MKTVPLKSKKGIGCLIVTSVFFSIIVYLAIKADQPEKSLGIPYIELAKSFNSTAIRRDINWRVYIKDRKENCATYIIEGVDSAAFLATLEDGKVFSILFNGSIDGSSSSSESMVAALSLLVESIDPSMSNKDRANLIIKLIKPIELSGKKKVSNNGILYSSSHEEGSCFWVRISKK